MPAFPNRYYTDPTHFSNRAKQVIAQLEDRSINKIKIGEMIVVPEPHRISAILYFHRRAGLVMCMVETDDERTLDFQGLSNGDDSVNKMLMYIDNIGQTDPESIPEMQLVRGHLMGAFQGTHEELEAVTGQGRIPNRMFVARGVDQLPRFGFDFFQRVLQDIKSDTDSIQLDNPRV